MVKQEQLLSFWRQIYPQHLPSGNTSSTINGVNFSPFVNYILDLRLEMAMKVSFLDKLSLGFPIHLVKLGSDVYIIVGL